MKGIFITLEGVEGSGKSTLLQYLADFFWQYKDREVVTTREPGGIPIAEQIRSLILNPEHTEMDSRTEALLYAAARRQHLVEKVLPALRTGKMVFCDRFLDSSLVYQGVARGIGKEEVLAINAFAIEQFLPDLTLYLDLDPELGLQRIRANGEREVNRLDLESLAFHQKVRQGYLELAEQYPERIVTLDASLPLVEVAKQAIALIESRFEPDMVRKNQEGRWDS